MTKNMGILDAYVRITCGLTLFGIGICKRSRCIITLGAMKTAEGITCFCPVYYLLGWSSRDKILKY
ncbi:MAG: YgaP family membrane protein [Eubacteriales bacterium]